MDENKNTYQRLQEMIKDESKSELFAAGGLFSGRRDDDHSALRHFGEYVDLRKTQNKGIPTTIDSGDFISYLGLQLADKPEELKGLVEKIETLKKHGAITEQTLANNTFYNFAVILSDLDIVSNPEKITSLYEGAFEEAIGFVAEPERGASLSPPAISNTQASPISPTTAGNSVGEIKEVSPQLGETSSSSTSTTTPTASITPTPSTTTTTGTQTNISGAAGEMEISAPVTKKDDEITGSDYVPGNVNARIDQDQSETGSPTMDQPTTNQPSDQIPGQVSDTPSDLEMEKLSPVTEITDQKNVSPLPAHAEGEQREFSGLAEPERVKRAEAPASEFQHSTSTDTQTSVPGNGKATPRFRRFSQGGSQFRHLTGGANRLPQMASGQTQQQRSEQNTQTAQSEAESESQAQRNQSEQRAGGRQEKKGGSLAKKLARLAAAGSAGGLTIPFLAPGTAAKAASIGSSGFLQKIIAIIFS